MSSDTRGCLTSVVVSAYSARHALKRKKKRPLLSYGPAIAMIEIFDGLYHRLCIESIFPTNTGIGPGLVIRSQFLPLSMTVKSSARAHGTSTLFHFRYGGKSHYAG
jgi:hypothetical protein